jgi:hypothetical protein
MFSIRAIVTVLAATTAFILPSIGSASASTDVHPCDTSFSTSDAMTPDDTPWN